MPVSGRSDGSENAVEHDRKIVKVMTSTRRQRATVSGKRWLKYEENRDGTRLVQKDRSSFPTTGFEKI